MKRQIYIGLPEQAMQLLMQMAMTRGMPVEELAEKALEDWMRREQDLSRGRAILLELGEGLGEGPPDLAEAHDRYLYKDLMEKKEREV